MSESQAQPVELPASTPVELGNLSTQAATEQYQEELQASAGAAKAGQEQEHAQHSNDYTMLGPGSEPADTTHTQSTSSVPPPITIPPHALTRQETEAIGPPTDLPTPMLATPMSSLGGPVVQFTLLLASTGTRHPYQLNERYLTKRNVKADEGGQFDPTIISIYTLKELIWKDWREDWDARPASPSAIRLIYFGRLLTDISTLKECKFNAEGTANVLHVTIKPQDIVEDEEAAKGGKGSMSRDRDGVGRTPGCRCVIL